jgi:hypothetical protein
MGEVRFTRRKMLAAAAATPVSLMLGKGARAAGGAVGPLPAEPSSANPAEHRGAPALASRRGGSRPGSLLFSNNQF